MLCLNVLQIVYLQPFPLLSFYFLPLFLTYFFFSFFPLRCCYYSTVVVRKKDPLAGLDPIPDQGSRSIDI